MMFANYKTLAVSKERRFILDLLEKSVQSVLPSRIMPQNVSWRGQSLIVQNKNFPAGNKRIFVIGAGKASAAMAASLEKIVGAERITAGIILSNETSAKPKKIIVHRSDHPLPSRRGAAGVNKILRLKRKYGLTKNDIVIALLSGGGSSLMPAPTGRITLRDKIKTIKALIRSGASVHDMTIVKKKISKVKGGKMAAWFSPTPIIVLVLSDVVGNDLQVIASGPFTADATTYGDAWRVIEKYGIKKDLPNSVLNFLQKMRNENNETREFTHVQPIILADNNTALLYARNFGLKRGLKTRIFAGMQGEAKRVAHSVCSKIFSYTAIQPILYLYGGETTVTLPKRHGQGGRNQEFVLACLNYIQAHNIKHKFCLASVGTDGIDFIAQSAGGIIDNSSLKLCQERKLNVHSFLEKHDAYNILSKINSNIRVGKPTGTNVGDIAAFLLLPL